MSEERFFLQFKRVPEWRWCWTERQTLFQGVVVFADGGRQGLARYGLDALLLLDEQHWPRLYGEVRDWLRNLRLADHFREMERPAPRPVDSGIFTQEIFDRSVRRMREMDRLYTPPPPSYASLYLTQPTYTARMTAVGPPPEERLRGLRADEVFFVTDRVVWRAEPPGSPAPGRDGEVARPPPSGPSRSES